MSAVFNTIGKVCFLLIVIGFCLPVAYGLNGFQIAHNDTIQTGSALSFALYGLFISAFIGFSFYIFYNLGLEIDEIDILWGISQSLVINIAVIIICICFGLIPFFINLKEHGGNYEIGVILIITGLALTLIFHIISFITEYNVGGSSYISINNNISNSGNNTSNSNNDDDDYYFPDVCP